MNTRRAFQSIVAAYQLTVAKHFFHSSDCVDLIHQQSIARKAISLYWFPSIVSFRSSLSTKLYLQSLHFLCPVWPSLPRQRLISEKRKRRSWTKSSCQIFTIDESVRQEPTEQVCKSFLFFFLASHKLVKPCCTILAIHFPFSGSDRKLIDRLRVIPVSQRMNAHV